MRKPLFDLIKKSLVFEYSLTNEEKCINCTDITQDNDYAFSAVSDSSLSDMIYNGIVDLAFEDYNVDLSRLNECQVDALKYKIRYNDGFSDSAKLRLGFYGEAMLNLILQSQFGTDVMVARGQFYDVLSGAEAHGYDSHHIIEKDGRIELWFGETKFYENYKTAIKKVLSNLSCAVSLDYINKNFQSIIQTNKEVCTKNKKVISFLNNLRENPYRNFHKDIVDYNLKLVYPIMILANAKMNYDETIKSWVDYINQCSKEFNIKVPEDIDASIFFIYLPVSDANAIKKEVIKCIQTNKQII